MKLQFDSSQEYQLAAVKSVVDIFEGQPLAKGNFEITFAMAGGMSLALTEKGIGNNILFREEQLLENIRLIQSRNLIPPS